MELSYAIGFTDKLLVMLTMFAALHIYSGRIERKRGKTALFVGAAAGIVCVSFLVEYFTRKLELGISPLVINNVYDVIIVVTGALSMTLVKKYDRDSLLFVSCASYATIAFANNLFALAVSPIIGPGGFLGGVGQPVEAFIRLAVFIVTYAAVFFACWTLFARKNAGTGYAVDGSVYAIIIIILATNIFIGRLEDNALYFFINFLKLMFCALTLAILFRQSGFLRLREENARLQFMISEQAEQYAEAKRSIDEVNIKAHDIKHFVELFKDKGEMPDAVLETLSEAYRSYENVYDTGSKALDVTLTEKCRSFPAEGIDFSVIADGTAIGFISDVDIYVLFGNLIENAKEAVLSIEDRTNRIIGLYLTKSDGVVTLHVENTYSIRPTFDGGLPQTSKGDEVNHGFGTKSIRSLVEKYGGSVTMGCDDCLFSVDIVFFDRN